MLNLDKLKEKFNSLSGNYSFQTNKLRPKDFDSYIGNSNAKNLVQMTLLSCQKQNKPFPHVLIAGQSGTGKTSLAMLIAAYQKGSIIDCQMPVNYDEWVASIVRIPARYPGDGFSVLIADEIHLQSRKQPETLYSILEENFIIINGERCYVPSFTAVGCTTEIGEITPPLRNRFSLLIQLDKLTLEDMKKVTLQGANKYDIDITDKAVELIARVSNSIPRDCNSYLTHCLNLSKALESNSIDEETVQTVFSLLKVNEDGIDLSCINYLKILRDVFKMEKTGIRTIAATIGENPATIELIIEPKLLNLGLIVKTPRGRMLVDKGLDYLESDKVKEI